ncbi:MAG: hypothetical protein ABIP07_02090 [Sphingomicrobium sp.]
MDARLMLITASALSLATIAAAEPANGPAKSPTPASSPRAKDRPVILAAAEIPAAANVIGAADADEAATSAVPARKPRTARVTTCRCADTPNQ